jgi:hypothetical protein
MNMMPKQEITNMTPDEKMELEKMRAQAMTRQGEVEAAEDETYAAASPKGKFSGKAANSLVEATNRLLPLFGIDEKYERFGGGTMSSLPPAFMRILTMFSKAIGDAIAEGALPEDAMIDLTVITDDSGLQGLAGRIGMAAKSPQFKRFLTKKTTSEMPEEDEGGEEEEVSEEMGSEDMDKLMMERM